jgi:16S rRNA (guanine527-N7)-methyltransferase
MDPRCIAELLTPFLPNPLSPRQLEQISMYIDLLLRWNARINLTAIRTPEEIVTRHFGESLFAARHLVLRCADSLARDSMLQVADLGSGAGFPGIPINMWCPQTAVTLIESNQKKVAFLREVIRALTLTNINVFPRRAEDYPPASISSVTLRAVERFDRVLPVAARLLAPGGTLVLLISRSQLDRVSLSLPSAIWADPIAIPLSKDRMLARTTIG